MNQTASVDSDLEATVDSLLKARPDLMDPTRLQLFERLLNRRIETRKSSLGKSGGEPVKTADIPLSKFTAIALYSCGAYFTVSSVVLPFPKVPLAVLPFLAIAGFFGMRYWVRRADNSVAARKPD